MEAEGATLHPRHEGEMYLEVTTPEHLDALTKFTPHETRIKARVEQGTLRALKVEPLFVGAIVLSCDRPDLDGDGVAELGADGKSVAHITARLVATTGKTAAPDGTEVRFRVTRGTLSSRRQVTHHAAATVELSATMETVTTTVTASAEGYRSASLKLEIIPAEELRQLAAHKPKAK
jgi:hypothetical protein